MTRLVLRLATPVSTILLGLLAACASNPVGTSSGSTSGSGGGGSGSTAGGTTGAGTTSGTPTGSGAGTASGTGGTTSGSSATSGTGSSGMNQVDAAAFCRPPAVDAGSLPFVVDTAYVPSGWMGDAPAYMAMPADPVNGTPASPATTARMTLLPAGYSQIGDACTPDGIGRSNGVAKGTCWKVIFVP